MSDNTKPLSYDILAKKNNIKGTGVMPEELKFLETKGKVLFSSINDKQTEAPVFKKVDLGLNRRVWSLELGDDFCEGIPLIELEEIDPENVLKEKKDKIELMPNSPEWIDFHYHPRLSSSLDYDLLKRRSGALVKPHVVFWPEDRQLYYPYGYPWHCIGEVTVWDDYHDSSTKHGSGALIGSNVVATASHLMPWDKEYGMIKFTPAYYNGVSILGEGVYSYVERIRGYKQPFPPQRQAFDIVTMKIFEPLGSWYGYFGARMYYDDWEGGPYWTLCGYPSRVGDGEIPSFQIRIRTVDDDRDANGLEIEHRGDSSLGNSGGPFFGWWEQPKPGPYLIGTHAGGQIEGGDEIINLASGGDAFLDLVRWARNNW